MRYNMRLSFLNIFFPGAILFICSLLFSCDKVNVPFDNEYQNGGPSLAYFNDYKVSLQTVEIDSFLTSNKQVFTVGYHYDSIFGSIHAGSYLELNLPATNPFLNQQNITFDSLQVILKPNKIYFGDTTQPVYFNVYQLQQLVQDTITYSNPTAAKLFYNTTSFAYNPVPLYGPAGEQGIVISPKKDADSVAFRIGDSVGIYLMNLLKAGGIPVSSQTYFESYFNGLYIDVDTAKTNTVYEFSAYTNSVVMRLYYDVNGPTKVSKYLEFTYTPANQFNHIGYTHPAGTPLSVFTPPVNNNGVEILNSNQTGNKAYLSSSTGYFIKISFPDILNLKAIYPYVRVVRAQLVIPPTPGTFNYPYELPPTLDLYQTNLFNTLTGVVVGINGALQTGDLNIDYQYGQNTQYTYDVTNFISTLFNQSNNSDSLALMLTPSSPLGDESFSRLVVNDQTQLKGVQLQLYVLGI